MRDADSALNIKLLHKGYVNTLLIQCQLRAQKKWKWVTALLKHFLSPAGPLPAPLGSPSRPALGFGGALGWPAAAAWPRFNGDDGNPRTWAGEGFLWEPRGSSALNLQLMLIFSVVCVHRAGRGGISWDTQGWGSSSGSEPLSQQTHFPWRCQRFMDE